MTLLSIMAKRAPWRRLAAALLLPTVLGLGACVAPPAGPDYSAFRQARPASIVVLPPLNETPEVTAWASFLAQASKPLGEAGYYVMPVGVMMETFQQNGLTSAHDIHEVPAAKLREIFGADAALYITITDFGARYTVLDSSVRVTARAQLVDLRTGQALWSGAATASNAEGRSNNNQGGLLGALITAALMQVIQSSTDAAHPVAGVAANRLLSGGLRGGVLYGPKSPLYGKEEAGR
ncbi:MAG: hypothetical protein RI907_2887 [Pseudomonadota bacterium]|jgi:hypothetical protein